MANDMLEQISPHNLNFNNTIRHKTLHNIPLMQGFLQLSVILQRHIRQKVKESI